ncbi:hypothetical protein BAT_0754 [Bacillus pumilus ATCC 7061]|nr:hypothetical protein BAT_0754 [Bacillus pumilus ATCC 7061]
MEKSSKAILLTLLFTFPHKTVTKPFMLEHIRYLFGEI